MEGGLPPPPKKDGKPPPPPFPHTKKTTKRKKIKQKRAKGAGGQDKNFLIYLFLCALCGLCGLCVTVPPWRLGGSIPVALRVHPLQLDGVFSPPASNGKTVPAGMLPAVAHWHNNKRNRTFGFWFTVLD